MESNPRHQSVAFPDMDRNVTERHYFRSEFTRRNIDGGDPPSGNTYSSVFSVDTQNIRDGSAKNPNWRQDIAKGNCATTPFYGVKETLSRSPARYHVSSTHGDFCKSWGEFDDQLVWRAKDPSLISVSTADSAARSKIVRKANEYQRPFQGGVFLAELKETLQMLKNPAAALFKAIRRHWIHASKNLRRHRPGTSHYKRVASGLWLEAVFGMLPLFGDIESAAKAFKSLASNASKRRKLIIANGSAQDRVLSDSFVSRYGSFDLAARYYYRDTSDVNVRYRAMLQWDASNFAKFRYFGLTPQDILPTIWEAIPWSFLADYFLNIQEIIEGYSFGTSRLRWVDRGEEVISKRELGFLSWAPVLSPNGPGVGWFAAESFRSERRTVRRAEVLDFDPVPDVDFSIPGVRQFANITALLSNKKGTL